MNDKINIVNRITNNGNVDMKMYFETVGSYKNNNFFILHGMIQNIDSFLWIFRYLNIYVSMTRMYL